jgi:hypothetical protein
MKIRVLITLGVALGLLSLYSIAESLVHPGRHCGACWGLMELREHKTTEYLERWLYQCPSCQAWEVEHIRVDERQETK